MKSLPKNYEHKEAENRWQKTWEEKGVYHWRDDLPREQTFVIDTPPPAWAGNVTATTLAAAIRELRREGRGMGAGRSPRTLHAFSEQISPAPSAGSWPAGHGPPG